MKILSTLVFLFMASVFAPLAVAQTTGVNTGGGQQIPPEVLYPEQYGNGHAQPQQPPAQWATRWGAIAIDNNTSSIGVSENQTSKSAASADALQHCSEQGRSQHCELKLIYYNQCAALAAGSNHSGLGRAPAQEQARNIALQVCQEGGGTDCKIIYTACAIPARIQ